MSDESTDKINNRPHANTVRQILMNELGLTRDSVREEVRRITSETVERYFKTGEFQKFLRDKINAQFITYRWENKDLFAAFVQKLTEQEIRAAVKTHVTDNFRVKVEIAETPPGDPTERRESLDRIL
jgi:hypothetical protein